MPKIKHYAVRVGRRPGVYPTWAEAEKQIKGFPGAIHKTFPNYKAAEGWAMLNDRSARSNLKYIHRQSKQLVTDDDLDRDDNLAELAFPTRRRVTSRKRPQSPSFVKAHIDESGPVQRPESEPEPVLSTQQEQILTRILAGENYFFTGSAGTGKSVLLRAIIKAFKKREREAKVHQEAEWKDFLAGNGDAAGQGSGKAKGWKLGVTASTGMAGVNIGGSTVHSWAGIGLGDQPAQKLYEQILKNSITTKRWSTTDALVVDEISMIDAALFDKLEFIARKIRRDTRPFGGLQLILSGDFFQLPPVAKGSSSEYKFAFEADSWQSVIPRSNMSGLTRVFRQKEDSFVRILESMRKGVISDEDSKLLQSLERKVEYPNGIEPVGLYPQKNEVAKINAARLAALNTPLQVFVAFDVPGVSSKGYVLDAGQAKESLNRNTIWPEELELKVGALVMLVTNMQDGVLVNGSTGVVVDFMTMTQAAERGISPPAASFGAAPDPRIAWPVVEFVPSRHASGKQAKRVIVPLMTVDVLNASGKPEATRHQIPLILAWALTIHKSQGQTLERVKIDLNKIFVEGQTYVAISRAVSLETLEILNFRPDKVMAHPRVINWARPLEQEQQAEEEWDELLATCDLDF